MEVYLDIGEQIDVGGQLVVLESVGLSGAVDLTKVVITCVGLARRAGLDEVRDSDGGQQSYDGDHDHDFEQGKPSLSTVIYLHTVTLSQRCGPAAGRLSINAFVHVLPATTAITIKHTQCQANPEKEQARGETSGLL
jgi:hypothetical protein